MTVRTQLGLTADDYRRIEQDRLAAVRKAAGALLDSAEILGWGSGDPFMDAVRWLTEEARSRGLIAETIWDAEIGEPRTGPDSHRKTTAKHRRHHALADKQGGWFCWYCKAPLLDSCSDEDTELDPFGKAVPRGGVAKLPATEDHVIPRAMNGSNSVGNLVLACMPCNLVKGA